MMHSTQVIQQINGSTDIKPIGDNATVHKLTIQNTGFAGVPGFVSLLDATNPPSDTGTPRWREHFNSKQGEIQECDFPAPLPMPDGLRLAFQNVTAVEVWVLWED